MSDSNAGGGFIDVRGAKLWYQISGQGEPLLQTSVRVRLPLAAPTGASGHHRPAGAA